MKSFTCIQIEKKTAIRFRSFSKKIAKTHTEALELMLLFFQTNRISPHDSIAPSLSLENLIKKRINGLIAILKNIERKQTLPTHTMMQLLFEGSSKPKKQVLTERKYGDSESENSIENILTYYTKKNDLVSRENQSLKRSIQNIVSNASLIKPSFGKGFFRLNISEQEFEKIKSLL